MRWRANREQFRDMSPLLFYTSPETARVNLAIEIPAKSFQFDKVKGKQHAVMNVLGMALRADGTVAARFSDTVEVNLEKAEMEQFTNHPYHYENQFYIAGGQYTLKLAVSSGDKFGQFALPLVVDHYDPANFSMSDLALSTQFYKVADPLDLVGLTAAGPNSAGDTGAANVALGIEPLQANRPGRDLP